MIAHVRADEACHRDLNHHFADIPHYEEVDSHVVTIAKDEEKEDQVSDVKLVFTKEE